MMGFPSRETVERIREQYPVGCKVELISMRDPQAPPAGTIGRVTSIDDIGTVHIAWSTGSGLGAAWVEDVIRKIPESGV